MKEIEALVNEAGLRRIYPVSKRTVYRWIRQGCPSRLIAGRRLFRPSAVDTWQTQFNEGHWAKSEGC